MTPQSNVNYNYKTVKCKYHDEGEIMSIQAAANLEQSAYSLTGTKR